MKLKAKISILSIGVLFVFSGFSQQPQLPVYLDKNQKLAYTPDSLGNQIPDFSYSGYYGGDRALPDVAIKVVVPVAEGDATYRIQSAIDYVSQLPQHKDGFRGAVLLETGVYKVSGSLNLHTSGVVLRGSGFDKKQTVIIGTGKSRETLIQIAGKNDRILSDKQEISSKYIPVNSRKITLKNASVYKAGDQIVITRPSTKEWISVLGTEHFGGGITSLGWKPGQRDITWDRTIISVKGNEIEIDAPITTALDQKFGVSTLQKYMWKGRVQNVGIENIALESEYDTNNPKDEDHRWMAITITNAQNVWVRRMSFKHFAGSAVYVSSSAKKVTVEDCVSKQPVSEIGGQRRYTFFTKGQQTLFQRLHAEHGYHDFAVGFMAAGPNAFVQCESVLPYSFSGAIDSWASGILFDIVNVDGQKLSFSNRGQDGQGAGWTAANSVFWQSAAGIVECYQPPTAQNWAFGTWAQFSGDGFWAKSNEHIKPRSLYYAQLEDRIGKAAAQRAVLFGIPTEASSSPQVETAMELTMLAANPPAQLQDFIADANERNALNISAKGVKSIDQIGVKAIAAAAIKSSDMAVKNGWLVRGEEVLMGKETSVQWWSGNAKPFALEKMKPHITRFVPGETGLGLTDDLQEVATTMKNSGILSINHNYGLWYDRRRDDHERIRRMDGEVWPPFYELPFARSGKGTAWDGLSKYDLTKYNQFYWGRLKQFADLADEHGLVLLHQNYFQHNILEAGAHYADFPWRTANNINDTGFPEPVPYAGDKRIFMAHQFYDIESPKRKELHRLYIRQCLDNFKDNTGVIQLISEEYTGPLHFVQFWIDVIKEWKAETGKNPIIALSATKDVQDAILADKERAKEIQVIDIKYWHYQADGSEYAPKGGQNLAPRQHARLTKPKKTSLEQVYRAVSEYRQAHPDKAVIYHGDNYPSMAWAVFMAGGSMAQLPKIGNGEFYKAASAMSSSQIDGQWMLKGKDGAIIYTTNLGTLNITAGGFSGNYEVTHIHPGNGEILNKYKVNFNKEQRLNTTKNAAEIIWITKK